MKFNRILKITLALPPLLILIPYLYAIAAHQTRSPLISYVVLIFMVGGVVEIVAVPIALVRLYRNEICRTAVNISCTAVGSILFILFIGLYVRAMVIGG
jgi:hypothetical protein